MFSAVYLICIVGSPCVFYVDPEPYTTVLECKEEAGMNLLEGQLKAQQGEFFEHTAEFQCINWEKA